MQKSVQMHALGASAASERRAFWSLALPTAPVYTSAAFRISTALASTRPARPVNGAADPPDPSTVPQGDIPDTDALLARSAAFMKLKKPSAPPFPTLCASVRFSRHRAIPNSRSFKPSSTFVPHCASARH